MTLTFRRLISSLTLPLLTHVEGIMEGKEWVWENGILTARRIESYKKHIKRASKTNLEEAKLYAFADFLSNLIKDK